MSSHLSLAKMLLEEFRFMHSSELEATIHKDGPFPYQDINDLDGFIENLVSPKDPCEDTQYSILFSMLKGDTQDKLKRYQDKLKRYYDRMLSLRRTHALSDDVKTALVRDLNQILENKNNTNDVTNPVGFFAGGLWHCPSAQNSHYIKQLIEWHDDGGKDTSQSRYIRRLALTALFSPFLPPPFVIAQSITFEAVRHEIESLPEGRSALCLSGGGIRSATFALGLIQSLARLKLLKRFDYLSTVSGGGYLGSWLSAWIKRQGPDQVFDSLGQDVCDRKRIEHPLEGDLKEIAYIRRFRNYLIPNWGIFSPDAWVLIATYLRNLFLNWLTLIPALLCALALVRIDVLLIVADDVPLIGLCGGFWTGTLLTIWSIGFLSYHLRSASTETAVSQQQSSILGDQYTDRGSQQTSFEKNFLWLGLAPLTCAGFILALFWARARMNGGTSITCGTDFFQSWWNTMFPWKLPMPSEVHPANFALFALFVHFSGVLVRVGLGLVLSFTKTPESDKPKKEKRPPLKVTSAAALITILIMASLISGLAAYLAATNLFLNPKDTPFFYAVFSAPLLLAIFLLGIDILVGLRSRWYTDEERERKARLNAFVLRGCTLWVFASYIVLYGPLWIAEFHPALMSSVGGVSGLLALLLGFSGGTKAIPKGEEKESRLDATRRISLSIAAPIGVISVVILLSCLTSFLILKTGPTVHSWFSATPKVDEFRKLVKHIPKTLIYNEDFLGLSPRIYPLAQIRQLTKQLQSMKEPYDTCEIITTLQRLNESLKELDRETPETRVLPPELVAWEAQAIVVWPEVQGSKANGAGTICELRQEVKDSFQGFATVHARIITDAPGYMLWCLLGGCLLLALVMPFASSINTFSLHTLYRERLIRTFLGASRKRNPDSFTGLDPDDNFAISDLATAGVKPFHVVNTAINLLDTKDPAWKNRRAASFTFTPLHSGSPAPSLGYRRSEEYGKNKARNQSVSLGTALAISGAAASPNMGYHSSPAVTFLMTLFNIRLGWWLGNPGPAGEIRVPRPFWGETREPAWKRSAPVFTLIWWIKEALGWTREDNAYVYLSDGGHFENLGLYEMVLRRCRFIVVSDAGCDPTYCFQDIGNAIRKIRVDLGVDIEIDFEMLRPQVNQRYSRWHHAIGTIRYDKVDKNAPVGILVYIKASMTGDEPADVLEYTGSHPEFPHQSTGDQFFDEAQFESYRTLGEHIASKVFRPAQSQTTNMDVFQTLRSHWVTLPPSIEASFLKQKEAFVQLEARLRSDMNLESYDREIYPELVTILGADARTSSTNDCRAALHFCMKQIQLMEDVFFALKLDLYHVHPLNRGWMNFFRRLTATSTFRLLWPSLRSSFSRDFVEFAEYHLNLSSVPLQSISEGLPPEEAMRTLLDEFKQEWPVRETQTEQQHKFITDLQNQISTILRKANDQHVILFKASPKEGKTPDKEVWGIAGAMINDRDKILDLLVWVRGAHRGAGTGRMLLSKLISKLKTDYPGYTASVTLPALSKEHLGYQFEKSAWLRFYEREQFVLEEETSEKYRLTRKLPDQT